MKSILRLLTLTVLLVLSLNSEALEGHCDQYSIIVSSGDGTSLLLPGGGDGQFSNYKWVALTEYSNGKIYNPAGVTLEWIDDPWDRGERSFILRTASKLWSDRGRAVTCVMKLRRN